MLSSLSCRWWSLGYRKVKLLVQGHCVSGSLETKLRGCDLQTWVLFSVFLDLMIATKCCFYSWRPFASTDLSPALLCPVPILSWSSERNPSCATPLQQVHLTEPEFLSSLLLFFCLQNFALAELAAMVSALKEQKAFSVYIYSAPLLYGPGQEAFRGHMAYNIKRWIKLKCTV